MAKLLSDFSSLLLVVVVFRHVRERCVYLRAFHTFTIPQIAAASCNVRQLHVFCHTREDLGGVAGIRAAVPELEGALDDARVCGRSVALRGHI